MYRSFFFSLGGGGVGEGEGVSLEMSKGGHRKIGSVCLLAIKMPFASHTNPGRCKVQFTQKEGHEVAEGAANCRY